MTETVQSIVSGLMTDGCSWFVPGVNCMSCGRFVGRDGWIGIQTFEMSTEVASVEGECRRCLAKAGVGDILGQPAHLSVDT